MTWTAAKILHPFHCEQMPRNNDRRRHSRWWFVGRTSHALPTTPTQWKEEAALAFCGPRSHSYKWPQTDAVALDAVISRSWLGSAVLNQTLNPSMDASSGVHGQTNQSRTDQTSQHYHRNSKQALLDLHRALEADQVGLNIVQFRIQHVQARHGNGCQDKRKAERLLVKDRRMQVQRQVVVAIPRQIHHRLSRGVQCHGW
ncbi:hypothetical protein H310_06388 [Aphanomyces invadans]|uniref:Uncharacterized protein n=1 Tax=Aphanomyces invadans TaxID=157072 RepID=A0A024U7F4_9STRA|nr:hypothetical protein H310_06388 [Aphanomyces invadans]ETW01812.1 hypothetical protein H310_06388 [Aphanomyces invadans]|eukprot:XP_008869660.1 hypothetical protein H310_06388 [Aphanomyces invadans]